IFVRGKEVDFSPSNIRRVMRFKRETAGAQTDYKTRQAMDQRLDEVLADLCILRATWKLSSGQPKSPLLDNMAVIAQELPNKGSLAFPSTIYKLFKDASIPLREFRRTPRILELSYITARRMEAIRFPRNLPQPQHEDDHEDEPMPQADGGNEEEEEQHQYHEDLQGIEETLSSMQFFQQTFYENMQKSQADYMEEVKQIKEKQEEIWTNNHRFQSQVRQEQERLAKEI
ncbi:hypothetical protein PIB30_088578, partial [Stylosanthes scabra]|nr:hypothetical protein [Stylosanthes scabra]